MLFQKTMNKKTIYPIVIERVTRNYPAILRLCIDKLPRNRGELTIFDIVHDTVLKVVSDHRAAEIDNDAEFVRYFMYRANTVIFKEVHDRKMLRKAYANYQTTKEKDTSAE